MNIPLNAAVYCGSERVGTSRVLIVDPVRERVTHLVVRAHGLGDREFLVPLEQVAGTTADTVHLTGSRDDLSRCERFTEAHFVRADVPDWATDALAWPYFVAEPTYSAYSEPTYVAQKEEHIPPGELALRRGARVVARDGLAGQVEGFVVAPETGHVTHLAVRSRHGLRADDLTVPVSAVAHYDGNDVQLNLTRDELGRLERLPLRRNGRRDGATGVGG